MDSCSVVATEVFPNLADQCPLKSSLGDGLLEVLLALNSIVITGR